LEVTADVKAFTHLFPEWALSWALNLATKDDAGPFWQSAAYTPTAGPTEGRQRLAELVPTSQRPSLRYERAFLRNEGTYFGLDEPLFQKTFWSLRPDFVVETEGAAAFLILEAKGGQVPDSTWRNPKELVYHRFLQACGTPKTKGLLYIVPRQAAERARACLRDQLPADPSITTGVLTWEELMPLMYERLVETALDQIIREMRGLQLLREWRSR
jgi:hypothetical protein